MAAEFTELARYQQGTFQMISLGPENGVNNYALTENPQDVPTKLWGFFGIYPRLGLRPAFLAFATDESKDFEQVVREILASKLPERIKRLPIRSDQAARRDFETLFSVIAAPSMLLAAGEIVQTQENILLLYTIMGITPNEGLVTIQDRILESRAKRN